MMDEKNPVHPLVYWERKKEVWPELYDYATKVLSVTPTTEFTERTFSISNRTCTKQRSSAKERTLQEV